MAEEIGRIFNDGVQDTRPDHSSSTGIGPRAAIQRGLRFVCLLSRGLSEVSQTGFYGSTHCFSFCSAPAFSSRRMSSSMFLTEISSGTVSALTGMRATCGGTALGPGLFFVSVRAVRRLSCRAPRITDGVCPGPQEESCSGFSWMALRTVGCPSCWR